MRKQTGIRLLFDENLPWRVAKALQVLKFSVSYVGDTDASPASPNRGSSDEEILNHTVSVNQIIVTSNLDMILLCVERCQQVIWIDPRGRQFTRKDLVLLVFKNINDWIERFRTATDPVCLRALRTKTETLELAEANSHVRKRMSYISQRRAREKRKQPLGDMF